MSLCTVAGLPARTSGARYSGVPARSERRVVDQLSAGAEVHQDDATVLGARDVVRFDVAMQEAGRVHRRHGAAELHADTDDISRGKDGALLEQLLERVPADELHPQADPIADLLRAVDSDDVRMPHFGEEPALPNDRARGGFVRDRSSGQKLQCDFAVEPRVPGAEHFAERAPPDALEKAEVAPALRCDGSLFS